MPSGLPALRLRAFNLHLPPHPALPTYGPLQPPPERPHPPEKAMADFSWSDTLRAALAPCLACLSRAPHLPPDADPENSSSRTSLRGLLADSGADSAAESDADALSLHSTLGRPHKKRRRRQPRGVKVMGWWVFGQPIRLPEDDEEEHGSENRAERRAERRQTDADAAPLGAADIARLASPPTSPSGPASPTPAAEAAQHHADAERRARRAERKARKKAALALALDGAHDAFEGFPGSGSLPASSASAQMPFGAYPISPPASSDGFGRPARPRANTAPGQEQEQGEEGEGADFGAGAYTRAPRPGPGTGLDGSGTRSRTSASRSSGAGSSDAGGGYAFRPFVPPSADVVSSEAPVRAKKKRTRTADGPVVPGGAQAQGGLPSPGFPSVGFGGRVGRGGGAGVALARRGDE